MLAPSINDTKTKLTSAYAGIVSLDGFATTSSTLRIVKLPKDPAWLPPVRTEIGQLNTAADDWRIARPDIWAPVITMFTGYIATFEAFVANKSNLGTSTATWVNALQTVLLPGVTACLTQTRELDIALQAKRAEFGAVLPQLDKSIQAGWNTVSSEEQTMLQLSAELGGLNDLVQSLGAKISSDGISGGKAYIQSQVSLLYAATAAGAAAAVPVLGIVSAVVGIGMTFYNLIKDNQDLVAAMNRINAVSAELSDEALGVALTKSTLQILYSLEADYLSFQDAYPGLIDLWTGEQSKIQDAINALNAGAQPDQYFDLLTLPIAATNWNAIGSFVSSLAEADVAVGAPVTIDIAKATVTVADPAVPTS